MSKKIVQIEVVEHNEFYYKSTGYFQTLIYKSDCKVVQPAPVQRKSIGVYEGIEVFDGDIGYLITYSDMKINTYVFRDLSLKVNKLGDSEFSSKVYLSPKEANQILKSEVEKVAKERTFNFNETIEVTNRYLRSNRFNSDILIDYAIELVEKEFNVKYLQD